MARPKEKVSAAFQQKCQVAADRLRKFQAEKLGADMERLFSDKILTDVNVELLHTSISLHSCVLKARSKDLYDFLTSLSTGCQAENHISLVKYGKPVEFSNIFKALYTEANITSSLKRLEDIFAGTCAEDRKLVNGEVEIEQDHNKDSSSEQVDNGKAEDEKAIINGVSGIDFDEEILYRFAEKIVQKSIREAKAIVEAERLNGDIVENDDANSDVSAKDIEVVDIKLSRLSNDSDVLLVSTTVETNKKSESLENGDNNHDAKTDFVSRETYIDSVVKKSSDTDSKNVVKKAPDADSVVKKAPDADSVVKKAPDADSVVKKAPDADSVVKKAPDADSVVKKNLDADSENVVKKAPDADSVVKKAPDADSVVKKNLEADSENVVKKAPDADSVVKKVSFRRNKDESEDSVQMLAERLLGVKMGFEPCSVLGEDLLRMMLTGESCNLEVVVLGQSFMVHSCILAARSSYFEAMLGGSWRESEAEQIVLEGVDPSVMRQMLLYLYGGVVEVDSSCLLGNLVMMSDMYSMEGLKEVVAFNLNKEYCHFFHRPCSGCISGVPDTLALTMMYNMDAQKEKCVRWITKNFDKVWPTKTFALLPQEVLEFCISSAVKDLQSICGDHKVTSYWSRVLEGIVYTETDCRKQALDNVIDVMVACRKLNETTPRLRWSEPVFDMITQLMDASIEYASTSFVPLVSSKNFRRLNEEGIAFNRQPLEDIFGMVITALSPENACQSYLSLKQWVAMMKPREGEEPEFSLYSQEFLEFVEYLYKKCKDHLCMYIHQAANTVEWAMLSKDMQQELMTEANYVCIDSPNKSRVAPPKLSSMQKKISSTSPLSLKEYFDRHFGSKDYIPPIPKAQNISSNALSKGAKGRLPTPSPGASSKGRKKETDKFSQNSSKERKQEQKKVQSRNTGTKSALPQMKSSPRSDQNTHTKLSVQKDSGDKTSSGDSKRSLGGLKKSSLPRSRTPNRETEKAASLAASTIAANDSPLSASLFADEDLVAVNATGGNSTLSDELEIEPRGRANSANAATFKPTFGQSTSLRSAQSVESFFDTRQGHICSVQRPLPVFEVKFIVPHEFSELF